jgi:hypothetical protein
MSTINEILAATRSLNAQERAALIPLICDQVSPEDWAKPSDEWICEVQRRSAIIDAGQMPTADWIEAHERARREAGLIQ